jgi:2-oxoglutarate/2-oxoacid ferredoxin oxidoreductase subunit alpha
MRERILMKNIAYAGALAALLQIDRDIIRALLKEKYGRKQALMDSNQRAVGSATSTPIAHFDCPLPIRLSPLDADAGRHPDRRQHGAGLGLRVRRRDGRRVVSDHPGHLPDGGVQGLLPEVPPRAGHEPQPLRDPAGRGRDRGNRHGHRRGSWAGARAFTPTAGPGISLMNEFIGLAYYAEVPAVIFDVQRTGPSTGMPTRTQQGDLMLCAYASHGDTRHICLYPADPREAFEFAVARSISPSASRRRCSS